MKKCPYCGEQIQDAAVKCRFCREFLQKPQQPASAPQPAAQQPPPPPQRPAYAPPAQPAAQAPAAVPQRTSGLAVAALVLGIIGLPMYPISLIPLILGLVALRKIKRSNGTLGGRGFAIAGTVLGAVGLVILILVATMFYAAFSGYLDNKPADSDTQPSFVDEPITTEILKEVSIKATAESWRSGKPYDMAADLRRRLPSCGVGVADSQDGQVDGVLLVELIEDKGHGYSMGSPFGPASDWGTDFICNVTLLSPDRSETIYKTTIESGAPSSVNLMSVYGDCLDSFQDEPGYKFLPGLIAAAMGIEAAYPRIVPALMHEELREEVAALLAKVDYQPAGPKERAYLAIANERYEDCATLGQEAVKPLIQFYNQYYRWEAAGPPDENHPKYRILDVLGQIGGKEVNELLKTELNDSANSIKDALEYGDAYYFLSGEVSREILALVDAAGKAGDEFLLPTLDDISSSLDKLELDSSSEDYEEVSKARDDLKKMLDTAKNSIRKRTGR